MKYKGGFGENTRTLYAGAAAPRTYFKAELWGADDPNQCYGCGTWGDEGLAEGHTTSSTTDGRRSVSSRGSA